MVQHRVEPEGWVPYSQRRHIEKKILPEYYKEVRTHRKMFELRKDEDGIQVGDILVLREWDGEYTGHMTKREVTYILRDAPQYGLMECYCILSLQIPGWDFVVPATVDVECNAQDNGIAVGVLNGGLVIQKGKNNQHVENHGTITMTFGK